MTGAAGHGDPRAAGGAHAGDGARRRRRPDISINCAGLHSDRVARLMGARPEVQIVPFRGEYYVLRPGAPLTWCKDLIYPVPDPEFPFLGVHFTRNARRRRGGPNAVLAFAREGYTLGTRQPGRALRARSRYSRLLEDGAQLLADRPYEMYRSLSKAAFVRSLQKLVPEIQPSDMVAGGAGVRAQAVSPDGSLVDDFRISVPPGAVHVLNAPSPAATASLAIGRHIAALAAETFNLPADPRQGAASAGRSILRGSQPGLGHSGSLLRLRARASAL